MYKAGSENEEIVSDLVGEIDSLLEEAKELQEKIQMAKGSPVRCSHCGTLCDEDCRFCPHCGNKLGVQKREQPDDEVIVMLPGLQDQTESQQSDSVPKENL